MNDVGRSLIAAAVILLASSTPTRAQEKTINGWILLGAGAGSANVECDGGNCASGGKLHGPTYLLAVGLMLTRHVGVGIGVDKWWFDPADTVETNTGTVYLRYYPVVRAGAFIEGGVGLSRAAVWMDDGSIAVGRGPAVMVSIGYDVRLRRVGGADVALTPRVTYVYSSIGDLTDGAGGPPFATRWRHQVLSAGLALALVSPRAPQ